MRDDGQHLPRVKLVPPRPTRLRERAEDEQATPLEKRPRRASTGTAVTQGSGGATLQKIGNEIVGKLMRADRYQIFLEPVDTAIVPDYLDYIKHPMDLGTVKKKLSEDQYRTLADLKSDLDLIWSNCCFYNAKDTEYYKKAVKLRNMTDKYFDSLGEQTDRPTHRNRQSRASAGAEAEGVAKPLRGRNRSTDGWPQPGRTLSASDAQTATDDTASGGPAVASAGVKAEELELQGPPEDVASNTVVTVGRGQGKRPGRRSSSWRSLSKELHEPKAESELDNTYRDREQALAEQYDQVIKASGPSAKAVLERILGSRDQPAVHVADALIQRVLDKEVVDACMPDVALRAPTEDELEETFASLSRDGLDPEDLRILRGLLPQKLFDTATSATDIDVMLGENYRSILQLSKLRAERETKSAESHVEHEKEEKKLMDKILAGTASLASRMFPGQLVGTEDLVAAAERLVGTGRR